LSDFPIGIVVWANGRRLETPYEHPPDTKKDLLPGHIERAVTAPETRITRQIAPPTQMPGIRQPEDAAARRRMALRTTEHVAVFDVDQKIKAPEADEPESNGEDFPNACGGPVVILTPKQEKQRDHELPASGQPGERVVDIHGNVPKLAL
jgi:hypothetical protein